MDHLKELITQHAHLAHWYILGALILAGFNIPLCIDLIIILSAFTAAVIIPENKWVIYSTVLGGCCLSAMCAYWKGRLVGPLLRRMKFFGKILSVEKMDKVKAFYDRYGVWTFVVGRFIPFGVRNCIFMSSGMGKVHFGKFVLMDALASFIWTGIIFFSFFKIGQNYEAAWYYLKTFNMVIFAAFSVTVITAIWYKRKKRRSANAVLK